MFKHSTFYYGPLAWKLDEENREKYGTDDLEIIELMEAYKTKCIEEEVDFKSKIALKKMLPEIKEKANADALKQVRREYQISEGSLIYEVSPFISETVKVKGSILNRAKFLPDRAITDPFIDDIRLYFDDINDQWLVRIKNGLPKLISRFVVVGCLIVNASGLGVCRAYVVFLKSEAKPLIFWDGIIEPADLRKQTQFHQKGFGYARKELYHESFMRALSMCRAVFFLTLPTHAGWNVLPNGKNIFVSSELDVPALCRLFEGQSKQKMRNVFQDIVFEPTERTFDSIVADYKSLLPDTISIKIGTVISAMSRLLPQYKEEGLVQDRLLIFEIADDYTEKAMIAVMQNRNHKSTEALFSSMRMPYIEEEITHYVDCVAIIRHSCTIDSKHDCNKIVKYLYEFLQNGYATDELRRLVPVLFIDNAGTIPEEFEIHQLSIADRLKCDNIEQILRVVGDLDYYVVKLAEKNPDAVKQHIKVAVTKANKMVSTLPRRSQSSSVVMLLSTAIMLQGVGVLTDADVQGVKECFRTEDKSRSSISSNIVEEAGKALSKVICSGMLQIANQFGPPFWNSNRVFIASDDSINLTKNTWDEKILPEITLGKNKFLQYLKEAEVLFTNKGEDQKTWTLETEDGKRKTRRFYSLSREMLTPETNRIIDEAIASDLFHKPDKPIDNFFPFIKHRRLDMLAGQVITNYKQGNTFIDVTGSVGSGKTDWIIMQVVQRAKAGDVVVVLDPTNAFCREELYGHRIPEEIIDNLFTFWDMSTQGWPINFLDFDDCVDLEQKVQRLSSLLISGMHLTGPNQKAIVMTKVEEWLREYETNSSLSIYSLPVRFDENAEERKLKTKLDALLSTIKDMKNEVQSPGWNRLLSERGKVLVISAGIAIINGDANPFDIILDTIYSFKDKNREGRMTVILDEVQTLNHRKDSTIVNILSRVRKLDISVILASQDYLNRSLAPVYKYCGTHIFFRPLGEECVKAVASLTKVDANDIRTLPDFHCAVMGNVYSDYYQQNIQLKTGIIGVTYRPPYVGNYDEKKEQP